MEPTNTELIQGCRRGDSAAWEALLERYQRQVYSIPRRAVLDEDRSAEVFQRVFSKLVGNYSAMSFRPKGEISNAYAA